jgi:DNA-binding MarR family transcriptional regulator
MQKDKDIEFQSDIKEYWHKIDNLYNLYAKSVGLNFITMLVLEYLYDSSETHTQKAISQKFDLPKQYVNSIIKSFWEQSYVELKEAKDRRNKEIILTDAGKKYAEKVLKPLQEADAKVWKSFTDEELAVLENTMKKFEQSLEGLLKGLIKTED